MTSGAYPKVCAAPARYFLYPTRIISLRRGHAPFTTTIVVACCLWLLCSYRELFQLRYAETWTQSAGQTPSVNLVVATVSHENISWTEKLSEYIPNLQIVRYVSDDLQAQYHPDVPKKGMEATIFHTYFRDFYNDLPDVSLLVHASDLSWHGERIFGRSTLSLLSRLDLGAILEKGYANLAVNAAQQQSWLAPCHNDYNQTYNAAEAALRPGQLEQDVAFQENFGIPKPETHLAAPCCSQIAVSRDTIRKVPRSQFQHHIDWLSNHTSDDPQFPGRTWEYFWQYLFLGIGYDCPRPWRAYCRMYGICFDGEDGYKGHWELLNRKDTAFERLRSMGASGDVSLMDETLSEYSTVDDEVNSELLEAVRRGADLSHRRKVGDLRILYDP